MQSSNVQDALAENPRKDRLCRVPRGTKVGSTSFTFMTLYRFAVRNSHQGDVLEVGSELADDEAARQETLLIIHDLTKSNGPKLKDWTMEVKEGDRRVWQIPFFECGENTRDGGRLAHTLSRMLATVIDGRG